MLDLESIRLAVTYLQFLANVNSRSRSLYAVAVRLSYVCLSSVTFVHPIQSVKIAIFLRRLVPWIFIDMHVARTILWRSSQGNPSVGGLNARGVAKYSDF